MLKPRYEWTCEAPGCCVFMGGTEDYDIYMSHCHKRPHNPMVTLIGPDEHDDCEFDNQAALASHVESHGDEQPKHAAALLFVQCFFPKQEQNVHTPLT